MYGIIWSCFDWKRNYVGHWFGSFVTVFPSISQWSLHYPKIWKIAWKYMQAHTHTYTCMHSLMHEKVPSNFCLYPNQCLYKCFTLLGNSKTMQCILRFYNSGNFPLNFHNYKIFKNIDNHSNLYYILGQPLYYNRILQLAD